MARSILRGWSCRWTRFYHFPASPSYSISGNAKLRPETRLTDRSIDGITPIFADLCQLFAGRRSGRRRTILCRTLRDKVVVSTWNDNVTRKRRNLVELSGFGSELESCQSERNSGHFNRMSDRLHFTIFNTTTLFFPWYLLIQVDITGPLRNETDRFTFISQILILLLRNFCSVEMRSEGNHGRIANQWYQKRNCKIV